jgi:hypothetical protein
MDLTCLQNELAALCRLAPQRPSPTFSSASLREFARGRQRCYRAAMSQGEIRC